jgi:hypothetical protein
MKPGTKHSTEARAKMRLKAQDRKPETRYSPLSEEEKQVRQVARDAGENWYFFPRPCIHGHISKKTTANSQCYRCHYEDSRRRDKERLKNEPWLMCYYSAQQRSKQLGFEFNLTQQDVKNVWPLDGRCPILGIELKSGTRKMHDASPSLDRVRPAGGYVVGNVVIISLLANRIKQNVTDPEVFVRMADWLRAQL